MQIAYLVRQSFDLFNTYGKDVNALQGITVGFCDVLIGYSSDDVTRAFKIWTEDKNTMPTPSDINKIIVKNLPPPEYAPPVGRKHQDFQTMTDIQKTGFNKMMQEAKDALHDEEAQGKSFEGKTKQDYSHFNRTPKATQRGLNADLKNRIRQH